MIFLHLSSLISRLLCHNDVCCSLVGLVHDHFDFYFIPMLCILNVRDKLLRYWLMGATLKLL